MSNREKQTYKKIINQKPDYHDQTKIKEWEL